MSDTNVISAEHKKAEQQKYNVSVWLGQCCRVGPNIRFTVKRTLYKRIKKHKMQQVFFDLLVCFCCSNKQACMHITQKGHDINLFIIYVGF